MHLDGSCHCRGVRFSLESRTPYPYNRCYCSICRKTAGGGGYAINIMGDAATLTVEGEDNLAVYRAAENDRDAYDDDGLGFSRRHFCKNCGSALWVFSPRYPALVHPFASAIDTPLPKPPDRFAIMTEHAAPWVEIPDGADVTRFEGYPEGSIEEWHKARGLYGV